jgi:hypothetical protein
MPQMSTTMVMATMSISIKARLIIAEGMNGITHSIEDIAALVCVEYRA